jgi:hypothetical protein
VLATGACAYRRSAFEEVGGFDERLGDAEDADLSWRVLAAGYSFAVSPSTATEVEVESDPARLALRCFQKGRAAHRLLATWSRPRIPPGPPQLDGVGKWAARSGRLAFFCGYGASALVARVSSRVAEPPPALAAPRGWPRAAEHRGRGFLPRPAIRGVFRPDGALLVDLASLDRFETGPVGGWILRRLFEGSDRSAVVDEVVRVFDVGGAEAAKDYDLFVDDLVRAGVLLPAAPERSAA